MSSWVPRTTAPSVGDPYYTSTQQTTYQPALNPYPDVGSYGFVLPNCTGLACGRQLEQGYGDFISPSNGFGNAATWWDAAASFCDRGQDPKVGAILVWGGGVYPYQDFGHVAVVEAIDENTGRMTISNSAASGGIFYLTHPYVTDSNYGMSSAYFFKGFIYPAGDPKPSWYYPVLFKRRKKQNGRSRIKHRSV